MFTISSTWKNFNIRGGFEAYVNILNRCFNLAICIELFEVALFGIHADSSDGRKWFNLELLGFEIYWSE